MFVFSENEFRNLYRAKVCGDLSEYEDTVVNIMYKQGLIGNKSDDSQEKSTQCCAFKENTIPEELVEYASSPAQGVTMQFMGTRYYVSIADILGHILYSISNEIINSVFFSTAPMQTKKEICLNAIRVMVSITISLKDIIKRIDFGIESDLCQFILKEKFPIDAQVKRLINSGDACNLEFLASDVIDEFINKNNGLNRKEVESGFNSLIKKGIITESDTNKYYVKL